MTRGFPRRLLCVIVSATAFSTLFAAGEAENFDPTEFSTGDFHGCGTNGQGSDPYLNSLKNRDLAPTKGKIYSVTQLLNTLPTTLPRKKAHRDKWTTAQRDAAAKWESRAVMVEGYLIHDVVKEAEEACNCGSDEYVDHHLWLAPTPGSVRTRAMVVEVSPRLWPAHPSWSNRATFKGIINDKKKVRVAGWLIWDQEHEEQIGKTRKTLWEVHPIHTIQVKFGNKWVDL